MLSATVFHNANDRYQTCVLKVQRLGRINVYFMRDEHLFMLLTALKFIIYPREFHWELCSLFRNALLILKELLTDTWKLFTDLLAAEHLHCRWVLGLKGISVMIMRERLWQPFASLNCSHPAGLGYWTMDLLVTKSKMQHFFFFFWGGVYRLLLDILLTDSEPLSLYMQAYVWTKSRSLGFELDRWQLWLRLTR